MARHTLLDPLLRSQAASAFADATRSDGPLRTIEMKGVPGAISSMPSACSISPITRVAEDEPVLGIVEGEALADAFDCVYQPLLGFALASLRELPRADIAPRANDFDRISVSIAHQMQPITHPA